MPEGTVQRLTAAPGRPARYTLTLTGEAADATVSLPLNDWINNGLEISFDGVINCCNCGAVTRRSYADGHCYACFRRLARCDLCVLSPARCHFAQGTCREPAWGEAFCMQPHLVYLANSSGPKVGITTAHGEVGRWLDQGATQGLVVARAPTRHRAGLLEERLSRRISDRTDWRALLSGDAPPVDLPELRRTLRPSAAELESDGVRWLDDGRVVELDYPVQAYPRRLSRLDLERERCVRGRLLGIKGQYLLFEHGVLNVRRHQGYRVRLRRLDDDALAAFEAAVPPISQMELFS